MFGLFKAKKCGVMADLVTEQVIKAEVLGRLAKAQSLTKLGRHDEAAALLAKTEQVVLEHANHRPSDAQPKILLAVFYMECGLSRKLHSVLSELLEPGAYAFDRQAELILRGALQNVERQQPLAHRPANGPDTYTQVNCCLSCGRLNHYVSMACIYCDYLPRNKQELAEAMLLSTSHMSVPDLIFAGRQISTGRRAYEVVPNLAASGMDLLTDPQTGRSVQTVFDALKQNEAKSRRSLAMFTGCQECGATVRLSRMTDCQSCEVPLELPSAIRAMICLDNVLWLHQNKLQVPRSAESTELICLLVLMLSNLLRKQEPPSANERNYILQLLSKIQIFTDTLGAIVVDSSNVSAVKLYLIEDKMDKDSETYGYVLLSELEQLVALAENGV